MAVKIEWVLCHNKPREHQTCPVWWSGRPEPLDLREGSRAKLPFHVMMAAGLSTAVVSVPLPDCTEPWRA